VIVDAHQHFWDPALGGYDWMTDEVAALRRPYGPSDLEPLLDANGVAGTVLVQARGSLDETRYLLELAAAAPFVLGVVGWVDLTQDVPAQLAAFDGALVGLRHQVHDEPDPRWLLRDDVQRGLRAVGEAGLAFDLLVRARELPAAIETVRRHPEIRFVLDHAAKRPVADAAWRAGVASLAEHGNVGCKLSGLLTEHEPRRTAQEALALFGAERCLFGSDWPVCLLATTYDETLELIRGVVASNELETVLARTAIRTYGLSR
jgi:L-fuconolactonase